MEEGLNSLHGEPGEDHGDKENEVLGIITGKNQGNNVGSKKGQADCIG